MRKRSQSERAERVRLVKPPLDQIMEPHGQSPWYLHELPSYAKASEGYPPVAKSAEALMGRVNDPTKGYAFIHGQSPWSSA
jgi:hypothetical protein